VPPNIGVRWSIDICEVRTPRAKVEGFHALELDRIVSVMTHLPHFSVIIGHADQIAATMRTTQGGPAWRPLASTPRVEVRRFPSRLSSRAGWDDLPATLNDDATFAGASTF